MSMSGRDTAAHVARRQAWVLAGAVLLLYALVRAVAGPLPQWPDYHDFADTRTLGRIPRAGDVLSNLTILAAGLWAGSLRHRVTLRPDERPAYRLLVLGAILTAFGSAYPDPDRGGVSGPAHRRRRERSQPEARAGGRGDRLRRGLAAAPSRGRCGGGAACVSLPAGMARIAT